MTAAQLVVERLLSESPDRYNDRWFHDRDAVAFTITKDGKELAYGEKVTHGDIVSGLKDWAIRKKPVPNWLIAPKSVEGALKILKPGSGPGVVMGRLWRGDPRKDLPPQLSFWDDPDGVPKAVYDRLYQTFNLDFSVDVDPFDGSNIGRAINSDVS
jgi:hypothetical protein